jgi:hypothetical protein
MKRDPVDSFFVKEAQGPVRFCRMSGSKLSIARESGVRPDFRDAGWVFAEFDRGRRGH